MTTPPPPSETAEMADHKHESVGVFSRSPCDAPRVSICACGATQRVGSSTWMVPPNPRSFDTIPPEQRAELLAFSEWLKLPKPRVTFEVYRAEHLPPPSETRRIDGVTWLLIREGRVLLERCPKKARVLGVGDWFVPGGKVEGTETPEAACWREMGEEWPGVRVTSLVPLPVIEGSPVGNQYHYAQHGLFLMRPYLIEVDGDVPMVSSDGIELRWTPIAEALRSPVPQVRMMVAAAESQIQPPPSETKLSEAIDELIRLTRNQMYVDKDYGRTPDGQETQAQILRSEARSSLESLYRDLATERDEALASVEASAYELIRLRSLQLTQDEAKHILNHNLNPGFVDPDAGVVCEVCRDADAKLRRISSKATSEEL